MKYCKQRLGCPYCEKQRCQKAKKWDAKLGKGSGETILPLLLLLSDQKATQQQQVGLGFPLSSMVKTDRFSKISNTFAVFLRVEPPLQHLYINW